MCKPPDRGRSASAARRNRGSGDRCRGPVEAPENRIAGNEDTKSQRRFNQFGSPVERGNRMAGSDPPRPCGEIVRSESSDSLCESARLSKAGEGKVGLASNWRGRDSGFGDEIPCRTSPKLFDLKAGLAGSARPRLAVRAVAGRPPMHPGRTRRSGCRVGICFLQSRQSMSRAKSRCRFER